MYLAMLFSQVLDICFLNTETHDDMVWPFFQMPHKGAQCTQLYYLHMHVEVLALQVVEEMFDTQQRSDAPFRKAQSLNAAES